MLLHKMKEYRDGYHLIPYCEVCGFDNPIGYCSGELYKEYVDKTQEQNVKSDIENDKG